MKNITKRFERITGRSVLLAGLAFTLLLTGCESESGSRASGNNQPMTLHLVGAVATRAPQFQQRRELVLSNPDHPTAELQSRTEPIAMQPSESFLSVEFNIVGARRKLTLQVKDILLIDGKGAAHKPLGFDFLHKENTWYPFESDTIRTDTLQIDTRNSGNEKWLFVLPSDAIAGSAIQFQNSSYPLVMNN